MAKQNFVKQYVRTLRYYKRLKDIYEGTVSDCHADSLEDDMYSFFLNCFHLKEWIKNGPNFGDTEKYIKKHNSLMICGDICNGFKHYKLQQELRHFKEANIEPLQRKAKLTLDIDETPDGTEVACGARYEFCDDLGGRYDAFTLATQCMKLWIRYFQQNLSEEQQREYGLTDSGLLAMQRDLGLI